MTSRRHQHHLVQMPCKIVTVRLGLALLAATVITPASAQDAPGPNHLQELRECRALTDAARRLACFDAAVNTMLAANEAGDLEIVDREAIQETRRGLFGFSLPKLGIFGSNDDEEMDLMQSQITAVRRISDDGWRLTITEGSVWQVTDAPSRFLPEVGDTVEFKKAALGSYFVRLNGQTGVKGRRVE